MSADVGAEGPIVVDWGSSNFRAYRCDAGGALIETHQAAAGILSVKDGAFEAALYREIGNWISAGRQLYLSGMITSRNGWVETPYAEAPARLADLAAQAVRRSGSRGEKLYFLPGVCARAPLPDVMRGEEIQVFGTVGPQQSATVVLPGTHSKWVQVEKGAITGFRTFLTGEAYALLKAHSIVGRLIPDGTAPFDEAAFLAGVAQAQDSRSAGLLNDAFTTRSGALLGNVPPAEIADRLSGMLIGHEIREGLALGPVSGALYLVGEESLGGKYRLALEASGQEAVLGSGHAAVEGFRRLSALPETAA